MNKHSPESIARNNERNKEMRRARYSQGLCTNCEKPSGGKWLCPDCYERDHAVRKRLEYARRMAGLCVSCRKPNPDAPLKARCPECRRKASLKALERYHQRKLANATQGE